MVDQNSFIRERPFFENKYFANLSRTPCLSFVESMLSNNSSYEIHPPPAKSHRIIADNFFIACQHPASIAEYPSQDRLLLIRQFFARLTGPTLSQNFRENTPIRRPQPSAGGASEEKQTPGALVFGSRKASLLEAWLLHLELVSWDFRKQLQTVPGGRCKDALQDHGIWLWRSRVEAWPSEATYGAVPFSCRTPGGRRW